MNTCINHPLTPASHVPWWPYTRFLDVEGGVCTECAAGGCSDLNLLAFGSEEFWAAFDVRAGGEQT
jgi:hypothetical protein